MERKAQLTIIFVTVFIYLIGFGIVIPIMPLLARDFGASPLQVGLLMSVFSAMQFIFSPFWGRLSDKYGRRPILLLCLVGEAAAYVMFAFSRDLIWLFISRAVAGFFGASLSTASAYISDVTPKEERSKGMALIGAAFGLGFLLGPAIGGGLSILGEKISPAPFFASSFTFSIVALLCLINFVFALKFLKESNQNKSERLEKVSRIKMFAQYFRRPVLGPLIGIYFLSTFAMAAMESTFVLYMGQVYQWGIREVSFGFAYIGLVSVLTQGLIVRRLIPVWGERKMMLVGVVLMSIGLSGIALAPNLLWLIPVVSALSIGHSFVNPSTMGSISLVSGTQEQGAVMGSAQGLASLARILGPAVGGWMFGAISMSAPFLTAGAVAAMTLIIILFQFAKLPDSGKNKRQTAAV